MSYKTNIEIKTGAVINTGLTLGNCIAVVVSWSLYHSLWWAFWHGLFGWFYIFYYILTR